ncbi:MAG: flagellar basal body P-ring formation chaperone FlgA [Thauera sp.]|nr:flagellar basal body P-ring formation chaperone FlgA [Thauera sp.]
MPAPTRFLPHSFLRRFLPALLLLSALVFGAPSYARQDAAPVEAAVHALLAAETAAQPGRIELHVSRFEAGPQLPACNALEAFLPEGSRAWGQVRVGVRCLAPSPWTVWVQARVQVFGSYLVSRRALRSGETLSSDDLELREGELSALPDNLLTSPAQAIGQHARFALAAGAPLRSSNLRAPDSIRRGQTITAITEGPGFSAQGEAQALNNAAAGERVRLRLPNGQIVHGTARADGSAEIDF